MALVTDLIPQVVVKRGGQWNHYLMRCQSRHVLHWRGGEGRLSPKIHLTFLSSTASGSWVAQFLPRSVGWGLFESHVREEYTYLLILIILLYCLELTNLFTSHHQGLRLVPSRLSSYVCVCHCQVVLLVYSSQLGSPLMAMDRHKRKRRSLI